MKIGIIGSGIAGLSAGWFLAQQGHRVTLFERASRPGMNSHSVSLPSLGDENSNTAVDGTNEYRGDIPSRMFNAELWPNLVKLYQDADVKTQPVDHRQSFQSDGELSPFTIELPYKFDALVGALLSPKKRRMIANIREFRLAGIQSLDEGSATGQTFGEFLRSKQFDETFLHTFLLPALSATVFTCPYESLFEYPAETVLNALSRIVTPQHNKKTSLLQTAFGTRDVVQRLLQPVSEIRYNAEVKNIRTLDTGVELSTAEETCTFDHVVISTQANQVQSFCGQAVSDSELSLLNSFQYVRVPVVIHTDESYLPTPRSDWSTFNFVASSADKPRAMCTVWMNKFHSDWPETPNVFQTILPIRKPAESSILQELVLQRPVVNTDSNRLLNRLHEVQQHPNRRIWYAGSYAAPGVPLLESGVVSSLGVAKRILECEAERRAGLTN